MPINRYSAYIGQRNWRLRIAARLKYRLGLWCRGCQSSAALAVDTPTGTDNFYHLVIPNRRSPEFAKYGNNTVTIYSHILKGKLPLDTAIVLCSDCRYKAKLEQSNEL